MHISDFTRFLRNSDEYQNLFKSINKTKSNIQIQTIDESIAFLSSTIASDLQKPTLIICPSAFHSINLQENLTAWTSSEVLRFPEVENLPYERIETDRETSINRIETISKISNSTNVPLVVTSISAICQQTIELDLLHKSSKDMFKNQNITMEELSRFLQQTGYEFDTTITTQGTYSRRGGILDVFPIGSENPYRIEFWGNEIDSIRSFDPETQRSINEFNEFKLFPATEILPSFFNISHLENQISHIDLQNCNPENSQRINTDLNDLINRETIDDISLYQGFFSNGSLIDFMPENSLVVLYRPADIFNNYWEIEERILQLKQNKENQGQIPFNFPISHQSWHKIEQQISTKNHKIELMPWGSETLLNKDIHIMPFSSASSFNGDLNLLSKEIKEFNQQSNTTAISTSHHTRITETLDSLTPKNFIIPSESNQIGPGFILNTKNSKLMILSDQEIFGITKQKRGIRKKSIKRQAFFNEISVGDYVVHVEHGIAKFIGTQKRKESEKEIEFLVLQYAQGDKLYIPMDHLDRVAPYFAPMEASPSLTRLGTQEWSRAKNRVQKSTKELAAELLKLYAQRELVKGHSMQTDTKWQMQLEESFPYEETDDQLTTISEVKEDMESFRPMDRLICGDVGYGKTEIAIRAAFKAVMDNKQVAILVPTTVLAQQHYKTFSERLKSFPCNISALSRFRTKSEQNKIVQEIQNGKIDICVGTHRLVQKDIKFKDLGLIIIDEEQRFGVSHKEKFKQLRKEVDILTLTATPIPRTLHMSLAGVRDMSTITTAPEERLPIKTFVSEFSDDLIREAILRELDRQGQIYFLHNRVNNIEYIAEYLRNLVPSAQIGIAHGQMTEKELEKVMISFSDGLIDVLVCTTIIESGLDIPNANTLIINRADTFGLAQLYQLRGRIGRSSKRGYSYLLIPRRQSISETAEKRLKAMLSATELGSGFKIAMKDLEIRGAGNILGSEQSGHIHTVGYDLYTRLLSAAVEDLRREESDDKHSQEISHKQSQQISVDLGIPASIPKEYIEDLTIRLNFYQSLTQIRNREQLNDFETELKDRFGNFPIEVENLIFILKLKIETGLTGAQSITKNGKQILIQFPFSLSNMKSILNKTIGENWQIGNQQIRCQIDDLGEEWEKSLLETMIKLVSFQQDLANKMTLIQ
ncbi:MAG: transcription-repair coupling factor [Dehalococcoidia bacterium]